MFNPNSAARHYILCVKVRLPLSQSMYVDIQCIDYFFVLEHGPMVQFWEEKQKCKGLSKLSTAAVPLQRAAEHRCGFFPFQRPGEVGVPHRLPPVVLVTLVFK